MSSCFFKIFFFLSVAAQMESRHGVREIFLNQHIRVGSPGTELEFAL